MSIYTDTLKIQSFPHPVLFLKSSPVKRVNKEFKGVISKMWELLKSSPTGVGLAANQVGIPLRFFLTSFEGKDRVWINPEIVKRSGKASQVEGCLSFPKMGGKVKRSKEVWVKAYDLDGQLVEEKLTGFLSVIFQHEFDHIEGINFIDKLDELSKKKLKGSLSELEIDWGSKVMQETDYSFENLKSSEDHWRDLFG